MQNRAVFEPIIFKEIVIGHFEKYHNILRAVEVTTCSRNASPAGKISFVSRTKDKRNAKLLRFILLAEYYGTFRGDLMIN